MAPTKKGKLRLVVDNAPEVKTTQYHQRLERKYVEKNRLLLEQEKKKVQKKVGETIEKLINDHHQVMKEQKRLYLSWSVVGAATLLLFGMTYVTVSNKQSEAVTINSLDRDLNKDGVPDAFILERNGHKIPMYGVREDGKIRYVGRGLIGWYSNTGADYEDIEDRLNEK